MKINNVPEKWMIRFKIGIFCVDHVVLDIKNRENDVLSVFLHGNGFIEVVLNFNGKAKPVILFAKYISNTENIIEISFVGHRVELYVNNILTDEDWPLGILELENSDCLVCPMDFLILNNGKLLQKNFDFPKKVDIKGYKPKGFNVYAGDCMPFEFENTYHLFYLFDRRRHGSKYGLGAHQWAHLATNNFIDWYEYPLAIEIDAQFEGSICTGSVIYKYNNGKYINGTFYAFYAVRMSDGSPARITWSTSKDCIHFGKSGKTLTLTDHFDQASARDPKVFYGEDGKFHMLVTTSMNDENRFGALAHLVSSDLENWTELAEPFLVVDTQEQPECPDYLSIGGIYYLIYSLHGQARYLFSKEQFGELIELKDNKIGTNSFRVPKMACFHVVRIIAAGFIPTMSAGYGGELSFLEVFSDVDGRLTFELVKELL